MTKNRDISKILDQATTFTVSVNVGANVIANTTAIGVGGNTINSTVWTGKSLTANDASYLGGTAAADFQTEAGLSANVATLTANNANYLGGTAAADYQTEAGLSANVATLTANNANYLGGTAAADYQTEAGLSANVATLASNSTTYIPVTNGIVSNSSGVWITANGGLLTNSTGLHIGTGNGIAVDADAIRVVANTGTVVNSTGVFVNATYIGTLSANNAAYLGGTAAADYQTEAGLADNVATLTANNANYLGGTAAADYQTEAGLSANVATLTANNANYLGGTAAASYALDTDLDAYQTEAGLAANVATLAANNSTYLGGNIVANSTGAYPLSNTSGAVLGNTISRFILTGNSVSLSGDVSAAQHTSTNFAANSSGVYHSTVVNSAAFTTTGFRANTTYVVPTSNSSGQNLGNTISRWILIGNTVSVSEGVYPDSNTLGTALGSATQRWVLNANTITTSGLASLESLNVTNRTNTATFYATTSANVGANITISTASVLVSNGGATFVNVTAIGITLANTTNTVTIIPPTTAQKGGNYYLKADGVWTEVVAGATPGGSNTHVQYNDSDALGGTAGFTFNETTNNVLIANTLTIGTATINSTKYSQTANNADYLGGTAAADYQTEAGLAANVATLAANSATYVLANNGIVSNSSGVWVDGANGISVDSAGVNVLGNTGTVVNSSGVFVNATYIGTLSANNASYLGGTAAADYQTEAGLADNVATMTANNATYFNTHADTYFANVTAPSFSTSISVGANNVINTTAAKVGNSVTSTLVGNDSVVVGNSTINLVANSTTVKLSNSTVNTHITLPTSTEYAGDYFLHANGDWIEVTGGELATRVYQTWTANDSVNTVFEVSGGYVINQIDVYYNGVHLANSEYSQNGSHISLGTAALIGAVIEVVGFQTGVTFNEANAAGANTNVQYNDSGILAGSLGFTYDKTTNVVFVANTITVGANVYMNTTAIKAPNTGLITASSVNGANGYTYLPGGILLQWGWVAANATTLGSVTFPLTFPTAVFAHVATSNAAAANACTIVDSNTSWMNVITRSATASNCRWFAIGN